MNTLVKVGIGALLGGGIGWIFGARYGYKRGVKECQDWLDSDEAREMITKTVCDQLDKARHEADCSGAAAAYMDPQDVIYNCGYDTREEEDTFDEIPEDTPEQSALYPTDDETPEEKARKDAEYEAQYQKNVCEELEKYMAEHEIPNETDLETDNFKGTIVFPEKTLDYVFYTDVDDWEMNDDNDFSRAEITYYEEDGVYCDENEREVVNAARFFGPAAHKQFGRISSNPKDVIFVTNSWFKKMYMITRVHNAYSRAVLGLEDGQYEQTY